MTISTSVSGFREPLHPSNLGTAPSGPDAPDEIFAQLRPLRAYAILLVGDPAQADDLVEETLRSAWAEFPSTGSHPSLRGRLFSLLRQACHVRLSQPRHRNGNGSAAQPTAAVELADFRDCLAALPVHQSEALLLIVGEGFSVLDAATICGCSAGTITRRAERGRRKLAETPVLAQAHLARTERIAF